ncbi:AMP-binding protein [Desulfovibrio cuneatus]|uniref:AMP-binding protein n=1 Tax=Desulfovibrio cuneatus TaxID=159728 RepID=UPI0004080169|nr:AMP-binding protein [Desulfovibrio cuneatus]
MAHSPACITIEGTTYPASAFSPKALPDIAWRSAQHKELALFLQQWFAPAPSLTLHTSGSTGTPKLLVAEKSRMLHSAAITCAHLGLHKGHTALLCLSPQYIAGKMMIVRAIQAGLNLHVAPVSGTPMLEHYGTIDLAAMVPLQVHNGLQNPHARTHLYAVRHLLVGGGPVPHELVTALTHFPGQAWATYGMTETLSHIALRRINGPCQQTGYTPLTGVRVWQTARGTLALHAPQVCPQELETNDIVTLHEDGSFTIHGRSDNIALCGGLKVQLEEVEALLHPVLGTSFAVTACPHAQLGEVLVLVSEQPVNQQAVAAPLHPHMRPKHFVVVPALPRTQASGKIDRTALKQLACQTLATQSKVN